MHNPPADLPESALRDTLESGWSLSAAELVYRPVGFGSHHWALTDTTGVRWFVTVDDLRTRRVTGDEPLELGFHRRHAALAAAQALQAAGRDFVVAPRPTADGEPLTRLGESFTVEVYPLVPGESLDWDDETPEFRSAILDLLVAVHSAPPDVRDRALPDDYAIQSRDTFADALDPGAGPYAQRATDLVTASSLHRAVSRYDELVSAVRSDPPALVLTHGEPHPANTMRTDVDWLLIDWDTVRVAPPERDLWGLDPGDGTLLAAYTAATARTSRPDVLELYRLRWDLSEIAAGLARFRAPHGATADDEETWANLEESVTAIAHIAE